MKHITSKLLSLLLTLAMLLSMVPAAYAVDEESGASGGITNETELEAAIDAVETGATVTLSGNVTLDDLITIPADKTFTLDLGGYSITQTKDEVNAINLSAGDNVTITGSGTITGNYNGVYVPSGATLTVNGATITSTYNGVYNEGSTTINGGTVKAVYIGSGSVTVDGGTIGTNSDGDSFPADSGTLIVTNGTVEGWMSPALSTTISGGTFNGSVFANQVAGGTFNGSLTLNGTNPSATGAAINGKFTWWSKTVPTVSNVTFGENAEITKNSTGTGTGDYQINAARNGIEEKTYYTVSVSSEEGGSHTVTVNANGTNIAKDTVRNPWSNAKAVAGDEYKVTVSTTVNDGYTFDGWYLNGVKTEPTDGVITFTVEGNTELVAKFVSRDLESKAKAWLGGYENTASYTISDVDGMEYFAYAVSNLGCTFEGKTVKLGANLDFAGKTYRVVGNETTAFKGVFDGSNFTISNIAATTEGKYIGLFGKLSGATVQNLTLANSTFNADTSTGYAGGIVAESETNVTIKNCTVTGVSTSGHFSGAVIAHSFGGTTVEGVTVTSCWTDDLRGGAIVGYTEGITIKNVTVSDVKNGAALVGQANSGTTTIENAKVTAPGKTLILMGGGTASFTGDETDIQAAEVVAANAEPATTVIISAGKFTTNGETKLDVGAYLPADKAQSADGTVGESTEAAVASINGKEYATLAEAINAANAGETVTLLDNIELDATQTIDKAITLDLNGKTLDSTDQFTLKLAAAANLTVIDNAEGGKLANAYSGDSNPAAAVYCDESGAVFTLKSGTITSSPHKITKAGSGLYSTAINGYGKATTEWTVNIEGGSVIADETPKDSRAIVTNKGMKLNISGGTIIGNMCGGGVDAVDDSIVTITGGTISGRQTDTGTIKETFGMRIVGSAKVIINGGTVNGVKMKYNGTSAPDVELKSGTVNGSFYLTTNKKLTFTVDPTAEIILENNTASAFLPEGVELTQNTDGTYGVTEATAYVAKIADKGQYETLEAAFAAAKDGDTITLLSNCSGNGIVVEDSVFSSGLTVDFAGYTYTVSGTLVGSNNSETNGFQLKKGNKITFTNGTITSADTCTGKTSSGDWIGAAAILLQNYCDLTLEGMTVTGGNATCYTMSNNNGKTVIEDSTIIAGKNTNNVSGPFAFDVCGFASYSGADVTVTGSSRIEGDIEISSDKAGNRDLKFTLESGTVNGSLVASSGAEKVTVTKSSDVTLAAPDGYLWVADESGSTSTLAKAVAAIDDKQYASLQAAFDEVKTGDTVTLLDDITLDNTVTCLVSGITLEGNSHTITCNTATDDTLTTTGKTAISFGGKNAAGTVVYCNGVTIQNLKMDGKARFALYFHGGKVSTLTNVTISGNYYIAINLYGTHGATMTNCNISNSTTGTDKYISGIWSNVSSANPLKLINTKVDTIAINKYTTANKLEPKIFIDENSSAEIHTLDDGSVSGDKKLCVSTESTGTYTIKEYDSDTGTWVEIKDYVAAIGETKYETLVTALEKAKSGETVKLLRDIVLDTEKGTFYNVVDGVTIDLNGHNIDGTSVSASSYDYPAALGLNVVIDGDTNVITITNGDSKAEAHIKGYVPLQVASYYGDSLKVLIGENVRLDSTDGGNAVSLGSNVYVLDSETSRSYFTNGGFTISAGEEKRIYCDFASAADAANGTTATLLSDYTGDQPIKVRKYGSNTAFTLDLGGKTYTYSGANSYGIVNLDCGKNITVINGTLTSTKNTLQAGVKLEASGASVVLNNVIVMVSGNYGIATNGTNTGNNVTLNNSTIKAMNGMGVYFPSTGKLTINGGSIEAKTGVQICAGSLAITGDPTITATGGASAEITSGSIMDGAAVSIVSREGYGEIGNVTIESGKFTSASGIEAVQAYAVDGTAESDWTDAGTYVSITGGTFSSIPSNMKDLCAEGYTCAKNDNDSYTVREAAYVAEYNGTEYESLQEAIDAASKKNGGQAVVTLLGNVTITKTISFVNVSATSVLLDLGGYTLTGDGCRALQINKGNLYLENGTVTSTGIINSSSVIRIGSNEDTYSGVSPMLYMRNKAKVVAQDSYGVTIFGSKTVSEKLKVGSTASIEAIGPSPAISGAGDTAYNKEKGTEITIFGSAKVSATNNYAIYHPDNGTLNIYDTATISGKGGIQMCSGTLKISGSPKIEALGKADHETGAAGPIYDIAAISAVNRSYPGGAPVVTITGTPTITTVDGEVIHAYTWSNNAESDWAEAGDCINVSGGTYSKTFEAAYLADGCTLAAKDGMYTVEQTPVAEYNGTQYTSLAQALQDARNNGGGEVKLLENVTQSTFDLDISTVTLNLNKKTLTLADGAQLYTSKAATIKKGTIKRIDTPTGGDANDFAIYMMDGSSLTLGAGSTLNDTVTLEAKYGIYNVGSTLNVRYAVITTEEWSIAVTDSKSNIGKVNIGQNVTNANTRTKITSTNGNCIGTQVYTKPEIVIAGGTLTSNGTNWDAGVVYWASEGTLTITGGVFNASTADGSTAAAVYQKNGTVRISGSATKTKLLGNNALVVQAGDGSVGTMVTELSGGFYSTKPEPTWVVGGKEIHEVEGGYQVEDAYVVEVTVDGVTTGYSSWDSMLGKVQDANASIKLLKNVQYDAAFTVMGALTIDFNGYTLTVEIDNEKYSAAFATGSGQFSTAPAGSITLKDSTGNGGLVTKGVYGVSVAGGGTVTVESGSYNCNTSVVQVENGAAYIKGGTFQTADENKSYLLNCIDDAYTAGTAVMEVTGGTFYGFDPSENPEGEGTTYVKVGYVSVKNDDGSSYTVKQRSENAYYTNDNDEVFYGDFEALVASTNTATKGRTITLLKDVKVDDNLVLFDNRTVDLNGNVLEIPEVFLGLHGKVSDSSDGNGLLKIAADNATLAAGNGQQIPIYDAENEGYRLFDFKMLTNPQASSSSSAKIALWPTFTNESAYALLKASDTNNIKFTVTISWMGTYGKASQGFTFMQQYVDVVANGNGAGIIWIVLNGLGTDLSGDMEDITAQGSIKSGTGAKVNGTEVSIKLN